MYAEAGGLISYGPVLDDVSVRVAVYVDKILKGVKPADLPVEQPTKQNGQGARARNTARTDPGRRRVARMKKNAVVAEKSLYQAIGVARRQSAKLFELRAAASLARLWRDQDKRTEARDLLAPIYNWFTEGFDTPVLKDAKALLDQLMQAGQPPFGKPAA
jgi:hypothetical protein